MISTLYDKVADAIYVELDNGRAVASVKLDDHISYDVDDQRRPVAIAITGLSDLRESRKPDSSRGRA